MAAVIVQLDTRRGNTPCRQSCAKVMPSSVEGRVRAALNHPPPDVRWAKVDVSVVLKRGGNGSGSIT